MTYGELIDQTARRFRITKQQAHDLAEFLFKRIAFETTKLGDKVLIPGFGVFRPKTHAARRILNPVTGEPMQLPPQATIGFRASKAQKRKVRR